MATALVDGHLLQAQARLGHRDAELPEEFKPGETSITHREYLQAIQQGIQTPAFLLDESVPWPPHKIDAFIDASERDDLGVGSFRPAGGFTADATTA